jgi:hypothetical protein
LADRRRRESNPRNVSDEGPRSGVGLLVQYQVDGLLPRHRSPGFKQQLALVRDVRGFDL